MSLTTTGRPTMHILAGRLAAAACDDIRNDCLYSARERLQRAVTTIDAVLAAEAQLSSLMEDLDADARYRADGRLPDNAY